MSWWPPHLLLAFQHSIQLNTFGHLSARNWTVLPSVLLLLGIQSLPPQISGISDEERSQKKQGSLTEQSTNYARRTGQMLLLMAIQFSGGSFPVFQVVVVSMMTIMLFTSSFEHQYEILNHHKTTNSAKSSDS